MDVAAPLGFHHIKNPTATDIKETPLAFLDNLEGPTVIDVEGTDTARTRVISTLIHGNEPSGFFAVHRWLLRQKTPATNVRIILSSLEAAKHSPTFTHRHMPNTPDLNRCFDKDGEDTICERATAIKAAIYAVSPECVVDLHNTSGSGPAFAVATNKETANQRLASFFVGRMIMTGIRLGALMEVDFGCPVITVECGGARDNEADIIAYEGLRSLLKAKSIEGGKHEGRVEILDHPMRVEILPDVSLVYGEEKDPSVTVTMRADIEHCNTGVTEKGTMLGWVSEGGLDNFTVTDEGGAHVTNDIIAVEGGALITQRDLRIFMATTREDIAHEDCLFYVVPVVG